MPKIEYNRRGHIGICCQPMLPAQTQAGPEWSGDDLPPLHEVERRTPMNRLLFKDYADAFPSKNINPTLASIVLSLLAWIEVNDPDESIVVTSTVRETNQGSTHFWGRAVDLVPFSRDVEKMEKWRNFINDRWDYGKKKIQVVPDVRHGTAPHLHIQVSDGHLTKLKPDATV